MNQGLTSKKCATSGTKIDKNRGQIEENWKFDGHLKVQLNKLETKDQLVKCA
jgi:hypothetical protein